MKLCFNPNYSDGKHEQRVLTNSRDTDDDDDDDGDDDDDDVVVFNALSNMSYQDNGKAIINGSMQWCVIVMSWIPLLVGLEPKTLRFEVFSTNHLATQMLHIPKDWLHLVNLLPFLWGRFPVLLCLFVCVEVLQPSQPNGVKSSTISLPNHTFTGQA